MGPELVVRLLDPPGWGGIGQRAHSHRTALVGGEGEVMFDVDRYVARVDAEEYVGFPDPFAVLVAG